MQSLHLPQAKQLWDLKRKRPAPTLSQVGGSWLLPYSLTADNETGFLLKAGNKDFGLSGDPSGAAGQGVSELYLKKKYR